MWISAHLQRQKNKIKKVYVTYIGKGNRLSFQNMKYNEQEEFLKNRTQCHLQHDAETRMHFRPLQVISQESDSSIGGQKKNETANS